jgi:hypothetical protein
MNRALLPRPAHSGINVAGSTPWVCSASVQISNRAPYSTASRMESRSTRFNFPGTRSQFFEKPHALAVQQREQQPGGDSHFWNSVNFFTITPIVCSPVRGFSVQIVAILPVISSANFWMFCQNSRQLKIFMSRQVLYRQSRYASTSFQAPGSSP